MRTFRRSVDAVSPNVIRADVDCKGVTIREVPPSTTSLQIWGGSGSGSVASGADADSYPIVQGEQWEVRRGNGGWIPKGHVLCYAQSDSGTITIALGYED